jgi:mRNA interferase RelE/StbE
MPIRFIYSDQAEKFVRKNSDSLSFEKVEEVVRLSLKKIIERERNNADIKKLKAEWKGHWRVRMGSIRVIFRYENSEPVITYITRIEFRGSVY